MSSSIDNYDYVVIIPSAVSPKIGVFSAQERFEQTLETVRTVKKNIPRSLVVLNDVSIVPAPDLKTKLSEQVDVFVDSDNHKDIVTCSNHGLKSPGELLLFCTALNAIKQHYDISNIKRIFKVGARVRIKDTFDISQYDKNTQGKYVFKPVTSWMDSTKKQYVTTCWSMPYSLIDEYIGNVGKMIELFNKGLDTEHAHYAMYNMNTVEFDTLHVAHRIAPNGVLHED